MILLDPNPPCFPDDWACAWGEDEYGLWQAFELNGVQQVMRWIAPGEFLMGSPQDEAERFDDELQHPVLISQGFWLAETTCTQELWQAVIGDNPSHFKTSLQHPVDSISWDDCQAFIQQANQELTGLKLRLPSEAEWEYACRAGTTTPFNTGENIDTDQANYNYSYADAPKGEYRQGTVEVKSFDPNALGLYQMHGNLWEWCQDFSGKYLAEPEIDPIRNPLGSGQGQRRVLRGGSWYSYGRSLRSAYRYVFRPGYRLNRIGLRLAGG